MHYLLETRKLARHFGAVVAANDINIKVNSGEIIGIIGANGAGKTTFVNMVTGHLPPSSGDIIYQGQNISGRPTREITRLGICRSFQIPQLFLDLSVLDNMCIAYSITRESRPVFFRPAMTAELIDQAMEGLKHFGIGEYAADRAATLPQGARKILDIAMATTSKPKLLFLDEPTSGVSSDEKMLIMETLLSALAGHDATVLFIEHDMEIIEQFAPRVVVFYDGAILADGPAKQVMDDPRVREFVIGSELHRHTEIQD